MCITSSEYFAQIENHSMALQCESVARDANENTFQSQVSRSKRVT